MINIKKNSWLVIIASFVYVINRASNDIPNHVQYWKIKSAGFLIADYFSFVIGIFILDFFTDKLLNISEKKKFKLFSEYGILLLFSIIYCYIFVFIRGMIVHGEMYAFERYAVGIILMPLFFCMFYAVKKHIKEKRKQQILLIQQNELKHEKLQTELQSLRAQYHPHFLFNALNTIYFLIDHKNKKAREAIEILSEILRYQVKCGGEKVLLQSEIEYLKKDIEMRKLRSSNQLILKVDFDESAKDGYIYPLIFTPIIENAFKYVGGDYKINITLQKNDDNIIFKVTNSLPDGYNSEERKSGTGLSNLKRRLGILYPDKNTLECVQKENEYMAFLKINIL